MNIIEILISNIILATIYMSVIFLLGMLLNRNDIADSAWGPGFLFVTISFFLTNISEINTPKIIILALVFLWATRLLVHISKRNTSKKEDWRYKEWREKWGKNFIIKSFLKVYLLQGFMLSLIVLPVSIGMSTSPETYKNIFVIFGFLVFVAGFLYETVGDYELSRFLKKEENKGKIMKEGLWKYTRHPNYFGEVTLWWGIWLMTLCTQGFMFGIIGPITITILITKVSGIPLLEKRYAGNQEYEEYKKVTSALIPLHVGKKLFYAKGK
ncbi:DUF1295 domain-containing protein [Candidatus Nomurabacteria bacterium]|nr:DUF1295 domain-containing protein [Candidatus Nomurabacteria bacterium]USN94917.1 MAG: DUF1295 domain-containing protein [Candidatus Nomurabacteria bacterium]